MTLSLQKIESLEDFRKLKNIWNDLLDGRKHYRPFLDYDWFELWFAHFLRNNHILILLSEEKDCPKAICPFLIKREKFKGLPITKIELAGNIYSPIRNIILGELSNTEKENFLATVFEYIKTSVKWDLIDLTPLPEEDFDLEGLKKALNNFGFRSKEYFCFGNWYLDRIDFTGDQYISSRTSNIRENIKRYSKKLQRMGQLEFLMVTNGSNEEIDHYMDQYYSVYQASWKAPEMDPSFHRALAKLARDRGWLRLGLLTLNKVPIAAQLWLVCERVAYIVKLAYDKEYKKLIPGVILTSDMMKYVIDVDKVKEIDYLIGDDAYKKDWVNRRRDRRGILIFNRNFKGLCLALLTLNLAPLLANNRRIHKLIKGITKLNILQKGIR